jgi:hypothetical protein
MSWKAWCGMLTLAAFAATAQAQSAEKALTQNGVTFIAGGIGIDSQARLKARESEFNLKLVFTLTEGSYLSDVSVALKDASGRTLVEHVADGPFFMARLPAGTYAVTATYEGKSQTRKVNISSKLRTEYLRWAGNPQADYVLPRESK